jgi:hypothetical protein
MNFFHIDDFSEDSRHIVFSCDFIVHAVCVYNKCAGLVSCHCVWEGVVNAVIPCNNPLCLGMRGSIARLGITDQLFVLRLYINYSGIYVIIV